MREHVCSHMATVCESEKFAKRASHRFFLPNKKINAQSTTGTMIVRDSIPKKFGLPVMPKIQVMIKSATKATMVTIAKILRNNSI